jgi:hypothetical protein
VWASGYIFSLTGSEDSCLRRYFKIFRSGADQGRHQVIYTVDVSHTAGSCRKRDIYRTRTYGLLQVSTGFHRQYMCRIYNAVSRSSSTPQVSQGFTGII